MVLKLSKRKRLTIIPLLSLAAVVIGGGIVAFRFGVAALPLTSTPTAIPTPIIAPTSTPSAGLSPVTSSSWNIQMPAIGVNAPLVPVGTEPDGTMASPSDADSVGWFSGGPRPGQTGNVLMAGHLDWTDIITGAPRTAVFWRLKELVPGDKVYVTDGNRRYTYIVTESLRFSSYDPTATQVLQPTSDARITFITCEGTYDQATRNYSHRRVVIAQLANTPQP